MKKILLAAIFLLVFYSSVIAQQVLELATPHSGGEVRACESVILKPGFSFTANTNNSLRLYIHQQDCSIHPHLPISHSVNTSSGYELGEIPLKYDISSSGAATYTVPIEVATGINGMHPSLALSYSSQLGKSIGGTGWTLAGLSSISRAAKTVHHNDKVGAIMLDANDAFIFDGLRLCKLNKEGDLVQFGTEQQNLKVIGYPSGKAIMYFKVLYPNGMEAIMGYENNTNSMLEYPITKLTDLNGNYITYTYEFRNEHYYITKIEYTMSTASSSPFASVEFAYAGRSDVSSFFSAGKKITEDKVLSGITCKSNGSVLSIYALTYRSTILGTLLSSIDCQSGGSKLNPLLFSYGQAAGTPKLEKNNYHILGTKFSDQPIEKLAVCKAKHSADSDDESLIVYPRINPYDFRANKNMSKSTYITNYHPDQTLIIYNSISKNNSFPHHFDDQTIKAEEGFVQMLAGDIDGFPGDELLKIRNVIVNGMDRVRIDIYKFGMAQWLYQRTESFETSKGGGNNYTGVYPKRFMLGDFDGDGKADLLVVNYEGQFDASKLPMLYIVNPTTGSIITKQTLSSVDLKGDHIVVPVEFNGDGKTDICIINTKGTYIYSYPGPTSALELLASASDITYSNSRDIQFGDFNGDGKTDILVSPQRSGWGEREGYYTTCCDATHSGIIPSKCDDCGGAIVSAFYDLYTKREPYYNDNGSTWKVHYANGKTGSGGFEAKSFDLFQHEENQDYMLHDVNMDGLPDLVASTASGTRIYPNINGALKPSAIASDASMKSNEVILIPGLGSSFQPYMMAFSGGAFDLFRFTQDLGKEQVLVSATSSSGVINKIEYERLCDNSTYNATYEGDYSETFPHWKYMGPMMVATKLETYHDSKLIGEQEYRYANGIVNFQGLGFRGFKNIYTEDKVQGITINKTFDPLEWGVLKEESIPNISRTTYEYIITYNSPRSINVLLQKKEVDNLVQNNKTIYTYKYSGCDPNEEKIDYGNGTIFTTKTNYTGKKSDTENLAGVPTKKTFKQQRNFQAEVESYVDYTYDSKYNIASEKISGKGGRASETHYEYDSFGNLTKSSKQVYGSTTWFETSYTYSSNGRFVLTETNPMGHTTRYEHNDATGMLTKVTNYKGKETSYAYGAFQRLQSVSYPDGTTTNTTYGWDIAGAQLIYVREKNTNSPASTVWYDMLGREVKTSTQGFNGEEVYTATAYDKEGRVSKTSEPYTSSPSYWTTNTYDSKNRISNIAYPTGKTVTYSYSGNTITTNDGKNSVTKTFSPNGDLLQLSDNSGTMSYTYLSDGNISAVTMPNSVKVSIKYDDFGRRKELSDPSAGTTKYTYDSKTGEVSEIINPNGAKTTYSYNAAFNMLDKVVTPEMTTTYSYDKKDYLLDKISSPTNGYSLSFEYDDFGRVKKQAEIFDGQTFTQEFTYNADKLVAAKFKDIFTGTGDGLQYTYNTNGYLSSVKLARQVGGVASHTLWSLSSTNERGQPLREILASGQVEQLSNYTPFGLLQSSQAKVNQQTVQSFSYRYNQAEGLLDERSNTKISKTELFGYDNLNRLTDINGTKHVEFDKMGNITQKSDAGQLVYNIDGNPYAIGELQQNEGSVPARMQNISYSSLGRPIAIAEGSYEAKFAYNHEGQRRSMKLYSDGSLQLTRYYMGSSYEKDVLPGGATTERFYLDGTAYSASAVWVKENGVEKILYIHRDHLGSITALTDNLGQLLAEYSYDAWGRMRNPATLQAYGSDEQPSLLLARGYTGHEHLPWFGLVNMNARLYDPVLGRFLSPDPMVQLPGFSQSYNRYSYCLNNPLVYVDENGELFFLAPIIKLAVAYGVGNFLTHMFKGDVNNVGDGAKYFSQGALAGASLGIIQQPNMSLISNITRMGQNTLWQLRSFTTKASVISGVGHGLIDNNWAPLKNSGKIILGNFNLDENRSFFGAVWQGISRHTRESIQTNLGQSAGHFRNIIGDVDNVEYFGGATLINNKNQNQPNREWGFTLGSFINSQNMEIGDEMFRHEYGHTLQGQDWGFLYTFAIAVPSGISNFGDPVKHRNRWYEKLANAYGKKYYSRFLPEKLVSSPWDYKKYPTKM